MQAWMKSLEDIATGRDVKLSKRSAKTVEALHAADYIRSTSGMDWHWELTERGQAALADNAKGI